MQVRQKFWYENEKTLDEIENMEMYIAVRNIYCALVVLLRLLRRYILITEGIERNKIAVEISTVLLGYIYSADSIFLIDFERLICFILIYLERGTTKILR